ncbi:MAG TPA: LuxR C-terminal-related transcriptional regulator [Streptosporangiaceae bacterium]|nr:LuxR C-terminal-related transcriptional regulator [Streptosporangiaceae bacterium]
MAIWLGWDSLAFRGEPAVARGWLQRAHRLLEGGDPASAEATSVLTARELDVLKLVAQGLSNTEIAQRLVLSEHTVHRHLANILRKLDLSPRAAAAAWGTRAGLI